MTKQTKTIDHSINGVKPINQAELAHYSAVEKNKPNNNGRFQPGNKLGGRKGGSKNKITTQFIDDLTHEWHSRGAQCLSELTAKELVGTAVAILPKDVMLSLNQDDVARWVINAKPLSTQEWQAQHGLIEHDSKPIESDS